MQGSTATVLIVTEAMHESASSDVPELIAAVADELKALWPVVPVTAVLSEAAPRFTLAVRDPGHSGNEQPRSGSSATLGCDTRES